MSAFNDFLTAIKGTLESINFTDVIEMLIIAFLIYCVLVWIKNTRTWFLIKGLVVILIFFGVAYLLSFDTILFLARNSLDVIVIALIIVFQPELRKAIENIGKGRLIKNPFRSPVLAETNQFTASTAGELVKAAFALGRTRTGALIVIEQEVPLHDYVKTGIRVDALVTSQLLINIFEHNTPLHDGAVVIKGNRVVAATCYLPLSSSQSVSKSLGTRHRAALGVSEVTDSLTIVVSEESGHVSVARGGDLKLSLSAEDLQETLMSVVEEQATDRKWFLPWRRRSTDEE